MIDPFNLSPYLSPYATLAFCFLAGLLLGFGYFNALRRTAGLIVKQGHPLLVLGLSLGRLMILGAGFYLAVLAGGFALLAAFVGVMCAKALVLLKVRRTGL